MEDQFPTVSSPAPKAEEGGLCNNLFYWLQTLVYAVVAIVLVFTFLGRITRVEGDSMLSTLHEGDLLLLQSVGYTPETGDVVVLNKTADETVALLGGDAIVKRVIATGGQTVYIDYNNAVVYVDGVALDEPYVNDDFLYEHSGPYSGQIPFVVPEGEIFVMGDNRNHSTDSRHPMLGTVDEGYVLGRAVCILFPFSDFSPL